MTRTQLAALRNTVKVAEANAAKTQAAHERLVAAFPTYFAQDNGAILESAMATDAANRAARNLRSVLDHTDA